MLILSRRETEKVCLGENIVLTIVRVAGDKVRIGIEAPPDVVVLRTELDEPRAIEPPSVPLPMAKIKPRQSPKRRAA
jgi:carbon storage regulator